MLSRILFFRKDKLQFMALSDSQIFIALFTALITGILAVRLGIALYK
jgi:photosystem I reaction center subunit XII